MDAVILPAFLLPYAAYFGAAVLFCSFLELVLDEVVIPYVQSTPGDHDDNFVGKYVEPPIRLAAKLASFLSIRSKR